MRAAWRNQKRDPEQLKSSARLGGKALWRRYRADPEFRRALDAKLKASRSRGGSISLRNLGEVGFKVRIDSGLARPQARFTDILGNKLRSSMEVMVANLLIRSHIKFEYERRIEVPDHAFYPDFTLTHGKKIIEVAGYAGDRYWEHTARKLRMLVESDYDLEVCVITTYIRIVTRRFAGIPRLCIFSPYQEAEIVQWCRGSRVV